MAVLKRCSDDSAHTPCPTGYIAWHEWAERKAKTHDQRQCLHCGSWAVWVKRDG
jgi:hypothetical protein